MHFIFFLCHVLLTRQQSLFCQQSELASISPLQYEDPRMYLMTSSQRCKFYQLKQQPGVATFWLEWEFLDASYNYRRDIFRPIMIVSQMSLPTIINSLADIYAFSNRPSFYIDLQNTLLSANQRVMIPSNDNRQNIVNVGIYNFGNYQLPYRYSLKVTNQAMCIEECIWGACLRGVCICDSSHLGSRCDIQIVRVVPQSEVPLQFLLNPLQWIFLVMQQEDMITTQLVNVTSVNVQATSSQTTPLPNRNYSDGFGLSETSSGLSFQSVDYPNFLSAYTYFENGSKGATCLINSLNYSYVMFQTDMTYSAYVIGLYNPNREGLIIQVIANPVDECTTVDASFNWAIQAMIYIVFLILLLLIVVVCLKCRQRGYCHCLNRQERELNNNLQFFRGEAQHIEEVLGDPDGVRTTSWRQQLARKLLDAFMPIETARELRENYQWHDNAITEDCVICLEPLHDVDQCRLTYCFHPIHQHCLDQWLKSNSTCPYCRQHLDLRYLVTQHADFNDRKKERQLLKLNAELQALPVYKQQTSKYQSLIDSMQSSISFHSVQDCITDRRPLHDSQSPVIQDAFIPNVVLKPQRSFIESDQSSQWNARLEAIQSISSIGQEITFSLKNDQHVNLLEKEQSPFVSAEKSNEPVVVPARTPKSIEPQQRQNTPPAKQPSPPQSLHSKSPPPTMIITQVQTTTKLIITPPELTLSGPLSPTGLSMIFDQPATNMLHTLSQPTLKKAKPAKQLAPSQSITLISKQSKPKKSVPEENQIKHSIPVDPPREPHREQPNEQPREKRRKQRVEQPDEEAREVPRKQHREQFRELPREQPREQSYEKPREQHHDQPREHNHRLSLEKPSYQTGEKPNYQHRQSMEQPLEQPHQKPGFQIRKHPEQPRQPIPPHYPTPPRQSISSPETPYMQKHVFNESPYVSFSPQKHEQDVNLNISTKVAAGQFKIKSVFKSAKKRRK